MYVRMISFALTFNDQFAGGRVTADAIGREARVLALVLREYLVDRENCHSVFVLEIDDLRRAQCLRQTFYREWRKNSQANKTMFFY